MFREVLVVEVGEVLRQWQMGRTQRGIARMVGLDRKTVARYLVAAKAAGVSQDGKGVGAEQLGMVVAALRPGRQGGHGPSWEELDGQRAFLAEQLGAGLRLTKILRLLRRRGMVVSYRTLHRFCVAELDFGRSRQETVRVADCEGGCELQVDFGRLGLVGPHWGKRRVAKGMVFTACLSRHQFCWPTYGEQLAEVIEGFEEAWSFFGGVFRVVIDDNLKGVVLEADALHPRLNPGFLEYAQERGFVIDTCMVRKPTHYPEDSVIPSRDCHGCSAGVIGGDSSG